MHNVNYKSNLKKSTENHYNVLQTKNFPKPRVLENPRTLLRPIRRHPKHEHIIIVQKNVVE